MTDLVLTRISTSEGETLALGAEIGAALTAGDLLALCGPLGAGKTVLVRGIAAGAGADPERVRSPTFVLHHVYRGATVPLHHLDLYRLGESADLAFLDVAGLLESGAVVVEWGDHEGLRHLDPVVVRVDVGAGTDRAFDLDAEGAPPRIVDVWRRW